MKTWHKALLVVAAAMLLVVMLVTAVGVTTSRMHPQGFNRAAPSAGLARVAKLDSDAQLGSTDEAAAPGATDSARASAPGPPRDTARLGRKLIYTATLEVEVKSFAEAAGRVGDASTRLGGYVAETRSALTERGARQGTVTVRVPAERFEEALQGFKALGTVRSESTAVEDVTRAYTDLEIRLRLKRETEVRLRQLLRTAAAKLSDVLEVERELARVIEELERMEGERRYFDQQVALSTITLSLVESEAFIRPGVLEPFGQALRRAGEVFATSLAWIVYLVVFLAPWLAVATLTWWVGRLARRRRARVVAARHEPQAPTAGPPAGSSETERGGQAANRTR